MLLLLIAGLGGAAGLLVGLLIFCLVIGAAYWLITNLLPAPVQKWAFAVLIVVVVILLISLLTGGGLSLP